MRFAMAANGMTFVSRQQAPSVGPEAILSLSAVLLALSVILLPPTTIQHCAGYRPSTSIGGSAMARRNDHRVDFKAGQLALFGAAVFVLLVCAWTFVS